MFNTIEHKGGFVQVSYFGNLRTIKAWCHGDLLGDHYTSVSGAKAAITRAHKEWVASRDNDHRAFMREAFGS